MPNTLCIPSATATAPDNMPSHKRISVKCRNWDTATELEETLTKGAETSAEKGEQERGTANSSKLSDLALNSPQQPGCERKGLLILPPGTEPSSLRPAAEGLSRCSHP